MHVTFDGQRLYVTNSQLAASTFRHAYALRFLHIGPDGKMKQDPFSKSISKALTAAAHDMLLN